MADDASTRFPFISLEKALGRAKLLFDGDRTGRAMPVTTAFELWSYSPKSSGGFQTVGALKGFGLIEDEGANADRKVKLTEAARRYFLDERDDIKNEMLAGFALTPPLFRSLWVKDKWQDGIPADPVARSHLKLERGLNDQSARALLSVLKDTIQFAGLKAGTVLDEPFEATPTEAANPKASVETARSIAMDQQAIYAPQATPTNILPNDAPDVRIVGDRVVISANLDLKGLRKLRRQITLLETYLTMSDDDEEPEA